LFKRLNGLFAEKTNLSMYRNEVSVPVTTSDDFEIDIIAVGKKSVSFGKKHGYDVIAAFDSIPEKPKMEDILPMAHMVIQQFTEKKYDKVVVGYTEFQSSLVQEAKVRQILPLSPFDLEKMIGSDTSAGEMPKESEDFPIESYYLEPDLDTIVDTVMPRLVEIQLYQAILESAASEHSARMVAMKNASENASDMIHELTLAYNKARQAAITQEIAEIAGGAAALE